MAAVGPISLDAEVTSSLGPWMGCGTLRLRLNFKMTLAKW